MAFEFRRPEHLPPRILKPRTQPLKHACRKRNNLFRKPCPVQKAAYDIGLCVGYNSCKMCRVYYS